MISSPFLALPDDIVVDQVPVLHECMTVVVRSVAPSAPCPVKGFMHTFDDSNEMRSDAEMSNRFLSSTVLIYGGPLCQDTKVLNHRKCA
jgi:hypothetical protein